VAEVDLGHMFVQIPVFTAAFVDIMYCFFTVDLFDIVTYPQYFITAVI